MEPPCGLGNRNILLRTSWLHFFHPFKSLLGQVCAQVCLYTNYTEDELLADLHAVQEFEFLAKNNQIEVGENVQKGKSIVIKRGIFKGWEGIVERRFNRNFVFVRLQTLGSSIGIECAVADCEVLD